MTQLKTQKYFLSSTGASQSVQSVIQKEESLWWEGFVKLVGFELGVKE